MLPNSDFFDISSSDTIKVESFTEYRDNVPAMNKTYSYLGGLYDPYFGNSNHRFRCTTEAYTEMALMEQIQFQLIR